jgi:hypothetical protein
MTEEKAEEDKTTEEKICALLDDEPFYDDRVEILASVLVSELHVHRPLSDAEQDAMFDEIIELAAKWELADPAGRDVN